MIASVSRETSSSAASMRSDPSSGGEIARAASAIGGTNLRPTSASPATRNNNSLTQSTTGGLAMVGKVTANTQRLPIFSKRESRTGQARREDGGQMNRRTSTKLKGEKFSLSKSFSPIFSSDKEAKAEFSALILPFSDGDLATSADCSKETVKCWKAERAFPNGRHLMALVADFPRIRAWHERRTGGLSNPQSMSEMFAYLEKVMSSDTPDGRAMRARLQQLMAESRGHDV